MNKVPKEVKEVTASRVACDGGAGGHPRVWLQISGELGWVECPYCDCKFVLKNNLDTGH
ncbi:MAG: zinc-finger domain-containing protein [Amylibacter sp.]|jgi:uncharacterized Zn-finger protein|tara:strand:- start:6519 stop:6695 length:177 start_codon:yes stop_codon:yes gene_type:complete